MIALKVRPKPRFFDSNRITRILDGAREAIDNGDKPKLQDIWSENEDVRKAQHERHHNGKCCYCERKRDIRLERDVEHYRPKMGVKEAPNHPGYWWLAYDWSNLLLSCKTCNTIYKKNHFPLRNENMRVYNEGKIVAEDALLINPVIENPEPYFLYTTEKWGGEYLTKIVPSQKDNDKSDRTIKILNLNRPELLGEEERSESYKRITGIIENYIFWKQYLEVVRIGDNTDKVDMCLAKIGEIKDSIKKEIRSTKTYSGFRRYLIRKSEQDELVELLNEI